MKRWMRHANFLLLGIAASLGAARAQDFTVIQVPSVIGFPIDQLKPNTIIFNDRHDDESAQGDGRFIRFDDWGRLNPLQKQFLNLFPGYTEGLVTRTMEGMTTTTQDKLELYIAKARFIVPRPAPAIDLKRYATLSFLEKIDPQIKHEVITSADVKLLDEERNWNNRNPQREWCQGDFVVLCIRSRYSFEGKIPMGIALANKLRDSDRKLDPYIEFENELRVLPPEAFDQAAVQKLTGINTPVASMLEQNIFSVNEVMHFGKFLAIIQPHPNDLGKTIATATVVLAVSERTLDTKRKYEHVPVLRNLVPEQVLLGNSSFNTGNSISAGLPVYARNRIRAIAEILSRQ
jgi:hypothetical protein